MDAYRSVRASAAPNPNLKAKVKIARRTATKHLPRKAYY